MIEQEITRLEGLFRLCQMPTVLRFTMTGLKSEVDSWLREFPQHPRLVVLSGEIAEVLKQS